MKHPVYRDGYWEIDYNEQKYETFSNLQIPYKIRNTVIAIIFHENSPKINIVSKISNNFKFLFPIY